MLFGQFEHSLDEKGRLVIPSKLKAELGEGSLYVLQGFEGCMSIYTKDHFDKLIASLEQFSYLNKDARNYVRLTLASVIQLSMDKIGRVVLSPQTLNKYNIKKDVMVIGVNDHIEVWDKQAYLDYEKENLSKYDDIADSLASKND